MRQRLLNTGRAASPWIQILSITLVVLAGCSKHDRSQTAMDTAATSSAALAPAPAAAAPAGAPDITPIRGTLASVSDSALTVSTAAGDVRVMVQGPLRVFARVPAKLSSVTPSSFVGVTSVAQPDGSERATEIHIFPEELRGTGEGSYPMTQGGGKDSTRKSNTMTNGTVSGAQKPGTTPQMTNGTIEGWQHVDVGVPRGIEDDHDSSQRERDCPRAREHQADVRHEGGRARSQAARRNDEGVEPGDRRLGDSLEIRRDASSLIEVRQSVT